MKDVNQPGVEGLRPGDPERIGDYRLLGRLGEGGMGTVYLATAPTGRPVAVKVIKPEVAVEDGFAARFHAEVRNARRVASFCTAQVLDNGNAADGRPYMVTEYIAGTPLSRQISTYGALEPAPLHGVALGVAAALAAIHVAGVVHRDLKPANVVLSMSGPRVIDFGIARALDSTHGFTRSGEVLGSPGWWAPEQVRGLEVTPAADVFAWGCLVAYAGNGRHPYGRGDMITMATRLLNSPPDLGTLPAPLDELARRATAMDPRERPTAQDLLIALVGGDISTPPATTTPEDPPTLISGDMLSESWRPPANVEPDSTQVLSSLRARTSPAPLSPAVPNPPPADASQPSPSKPGTASARQARRRWLLAGLAVTAALAVTVAVLVRAGEGTGGGTPPVTTTTGGATDVGRRIATGSLIEDPQLIIPRGPRCGLPSYEGTTARGRLCVIGMTLLNTGGKEVPLSRTPLTLVDDLGALHTPEPVGANPANTTGKLAPGGRMDDVLVYDLSPGRRPVRLTGQVVEGGRRIEVRL
ncbi:protein kinase [Streptosporangium sp. NPDC051023]|uniref:serine/threonine-protein kinase n=1 Tax=Streptosporangium sp. NPDC051023 TaxID=3155410 RepID=UPI00344CCA52